MILASSAKGEEVEHYLDLLDARELVAGWTTAADVERTKPDRSWSRRHWRNTAPAARR